MSLPTNLVFVADTPEPKPIVPLYRMVQTKRDRNYWDECNKPLGPKSEWVTAQQEKIKGTKFLLDEIYKLARIQNNLGTNLKPGCWEQEEIAGKADALNSLFSAFMGAFFGSDWKKDIAFEKLKKLIDDALKANDAEAAFRQCCKEN